MIIKERAKLPGEHLWRITLDDQLRHTLTDFIVGNHSLGQRNSQMAIDFEASATSRAVKRANIASVQLHSFCCFRERNPWSVRSNASPDRWEGSPRCSSTAETIVGENREKARRWEVGEKGGKDWALRDDSSINHKHWAEVSASDRERLPFRTGVGLRLFSSFTFRTTLLGGVS